MKLTIEYEIRDGKFAGLDEEILANFFRVMRETRCHPTETNFYGEEGAHPYNGKPYLVVTKVGNTEA